MEPRLVKEAAIGYNCISYEYNRKGDMTMSLLENWRNRAYGEGTDRKQKEELWKKYFLIEKGIYEKLLEDHTQVLNLTLTELARKFDTDIEMITGFLDGINDSLKEQNPIETMDENTSVTIEIEPEKLYYNMVEAKAEWLYELPQWEAILSKERRKELYKEQKKSGTIVKDKKIGRNEPCPCGSGKKYKHCCGQ